jgi:hypothetical protein
MKNAVSAVGILVIHCEEDVKEIQERPSSGFDERLSLFKAGFC